MITISPESVAIGEIIIVKPGEKIPLDGVVLDGDSMLDTRALTGESVPRSVHKGDEALSGCMNQKMCIRDSFSAYPPSASGTILLPLFFPVLSIP